VHFLIDKCVLKHSFYPVHKCKLDYSLTVDPAGSTLLIPETTTGHDPEWVTSTSQLYNIFP